MKTIETIFNLQLFADTVPESVLRLNTNKTAAWNNDTQAYEKGALSAEMKVYYSDYLIDNAIPKLVHDQFGQKCNIGKESVSGCCTKCNKRAETRRNNAIKFPCISRWLAKLCAKCAPKGGI